MVTRMNPDIIKYKGEICELRRNLRQIEETGTAPINLILYKKLGLIKLKHKTFYKGDWRECKVLDKLLLTDKAKQILTLEV